MIPKTNGNVLKWALENPRAVDELIDFYNNFPAMTLRLVAPEGAPVAGTNPIVTQQSILLPIPVQFRSRIAAPSGGATVDSQCRAQLTALLAALTITGINP